MTIKTFTSFALGAGLLLTSITPVFAQSASPTTRKEVREAMKEARTDARCTVGTTRIDERIKFYTDHKEDHVQRYANIKTRVARMLNLLKSKGVDVAQLEADLKTLDGKIKVFADAVVAFQAKLEATKTYNCGSSEGAFRDAVKAAQTARQAVFAAAKDVQTYLQGTIIPEVKALTAKVPKASAQ